VDFSGESQEKKSIFLSTFDAGVAFFENRACAGVTITFTAISFPSMYEITGRKAALSSGEVSSWISAP